MTTQLTYSVTEDASYVDWQYVDGTGADYSSYFIAGYKLHGEGQRKFQVNRIFVFSEVEAGSSAFIQYLWDFANSSSGHRYSTAEQVYVSKSYVSHVVKNMWLRGGGLALQFKIYSASGAPFNIIGFSLFESGNAQP